MARVDSVEVAVSLHEDFLRRHRRDRARAEAAWAALVRAGRSLREDPFVGTQVPNDRFPKKYQAYDNLWKLDLPGAFRAAYTVLGRSGGGVRVAAEWIGDHREYDRLFGYA